jgi:hypothetical protein
MTRTAAVVAATMTTPPAPPVWSEPHYVLAMPSPAAGARWSPHLRCGRPPARERPFGAWTRPLAFLLALYTLGTALIGHHFWTMEGAARYANVIDFYKNLGIIGGCLLLYVTGPGRYSVDAALGRADAFGTTRRRQDVA